MYLCVHIYDRTVVTLQREILCVFFSQSLYSWYRMKSSRKCRRRRKNYTLTHNMWMCHIWYTIYYIFFPYDCADGLYGLEQRARNRDSKTESKINKVLELCVAKTKIWVPNNKKWEKNSSFSSSTNGNVRAIVDFVDCRVDVCVRVLFFFSVEMLFLLFNLNCVWVCLMISMIVVKIKARTFGSLSLPPARSLVHEWVLWNRRANLLVLAALPILAQYCWCDFVISFKVFLHASTFFFDGSTYQSRLSDEHFPSLSNARIACRLHWHFYFLDLYSHNKIAKPRCFVAPESHQHC